VGFGNADAEGAQGRHFGDGLVRDQRVGEVPAMGVRDDPLVGEAPVLVADGVQQVVAQTVRYDGAVPQEPHELCAMGGGVAVFDDPPHGRVGRQRAGGRLGA
jgi:hypothetical protein